MALEVRRIVTGHDLQGKASSRPTSALPAPGRRVGRASPASTSGRPTRCQSTTPMRPPSCSARALSSATITSARARAACVGWSSSRRPGAKFMHRTETLDYAIYIKGECDLELDDGRTVPMKAGDICVQRGTMHAWVAKGSEPVVFAFVLIDAEPVEKGGKS